MPHPDTPVSATLDAIRERADKAMTDDQVTAYLTTVKALIKTAQTVPATARLNPADTEVEHLMVTDLFPAIVAAVEAVLELADEMDNHGRTRSPVARASARIVRETIRAALSGEEAGDGG